MPREIMVCLRCEDAAEPARVTPGSIWIEIVLWLAFLVPGLVYSIWRLTARHHACPNCGGADLVPLHSSAARRVLAGRPEGARLAELASRARAGSGAPSGSIAGAVIVVVLVFAAVIGVGMCGRDIAGGAGPAARDAR